MTRAKVISEQQKKHTKEQRDTLHTYLLFSHKKLFILKESKVK